MFSRRFFSIRAAALLSCVVLGTSPLNAATFHLKAVKLNDAPITPTSQVSVHPGDTIVAEFYVSGWNADMSGSRLQTLQASIDRLGHVSGPRGMILPKGWDAPLDLQACTNQLDCPAAQPRCEYGFCESFCNSNADCPTEYPICGSTRRCVGVNHNPANANAFIDTTRPDFVHFDQSSISAVRVASLGFAYGSTPLIGEGPLDTGVSRYLGTLTLVASDDACGAFTIDLERRIAVTFIALSIPMPPYRFVFGSTIVPLNIDVACQTSACCVSRNPCENTSRSDCVARGGTWQEGQFCAEGDQTCPRLPTMRDPTGIR